MSASKTTAAARPPDRPRSLGGADIAKMRRPPTHPGEIFEEEWRKPSGVSQAAAARRMGMSTNRLNEIVAGKRSVTAENAVLLGALTGTDPLFWLSLQANYDLWHALRKTDVTRITQITAPATG